MEAHNLHTWVRFLFNHHWLVVWDHRRADVYSLQFPWQKPVRLKPNRAGWLKLRRGRWLGLGLRDDTIWAAEHARELRFKRYRLTPQGIYHESTLRLKQALPELPEFWLFPFGRLQTLLHAPHLSDRYGLVERPYHGDALLFLLPHLTAYHVCTTDGRPVPVLRQAHHLVILDDQFGIKQRFSFDAPIIDASVDNVASRLYALSPKALHVVHLPSCDTQRIFPIHQPYRYIRAQGGCFALISEDAQIVHIFQDTGHLIDRLHGRLLLSNIGIAVANGATVRIYNNKQCETIQADAESVLGAFSTPYEWLFVYAPDS